MPMPDERNDVSRQPRKLQGWKKYFYTEAGFVLVFVSFVTALYWYKDISGSDDHEDGFLYQKLIFLKSIFGDYYVSIFLSLVVLLISFEVWRQGRR